MYNVCKFTKPAKDGTVISVVPTPWMFKEGGVLKCRWVKSRDKIKDVATPLSAWPVLEIEKILKKKIG